MDNKTISFTAANSIPVKIFRNINLVQQLCQEYIPPMHVQLIPTNRCNLACSFCSCRNRNKKDELTIEEIETLFSEFETLGCKSVTITGGGEPLLHKDFKKILKIISDHGIKIGLVTNGLLLHILNEDDFQKITWCRISCADERNFDEAADVIKNAVKLGVNVDWAFSYVVGKDYNSENLNKYIKFANECKFTHVRVVSDLCDLERCEEMDLIKSKIRGDDSRVIYQGRKQFDQGQEKCRISLLKPVIGADGYIYPCCGVQYAHLIEDLDNPHNMRMGRIENIREIYQDQKYFNGEQCFRCYYKNYNDILDQMVSQMKHLEFV